MEEKKRLIYPDVLRIVSIFCVVLIHIASKLWKTVSIYSVTWVSLVAIDSICRFAVPVFVMVSGMFMLSPEKDRGLKDLYSKKILRLLTSFVFWSAFYVIFNTLSGIILSRKTDLSVYKLVGDFIIGKYHLWFIYMIIGLYIVTPLLRKIVSSKRDMEYFLIIWFVFCIFRNCVPLIPQYGEQFDKLFSAFKISMALEYSGYYVLGYYLHNYDIPKKIQTAIHIFAVLGVLGMIGLTTYASHKNSNHEEFYFEYLLPMTMFLSVSVFLRVKKICADKNPSQKSRSIIGTLSKISFGVYLSHLFIMDIMFYICNRRLELPCFASFGIMLVTTLIFSNLISYILNKIPLVNKYLV